MRSLIVALLLLAPGLAQASGQRPSAPATVEPGALCLPAVAAAERAENIPAGLLRSIALVESGRVDPVSGRAVPWPWTINAEGQGRYFETREAAIAETRALLAGGMRSIDVGCGQVNLLHHPAAFASLEAAFDPAANTAYAARFLRSLHGATGSWPFAAAAYHSQTPERGHAYALRVAAAWSDAHRHGPWPAAPADLPTGLRVGAAAARPDYSLFTPAFAAQVRRMDEDRARSAAPALRTRPAASGPAQRRGDR
ncbi:MAG: transglycosylase SLT domain-containing protein, partial [Acetobacteraceae bacterium]|nr:transglycosylase SLT domain-containing protein [Acetobacteraceae bacterium]